MARRKYTLPRHTNLANQGPRIGAFLIDLAISLALSLAFLFGCFRFVFAFKTKPLESRIEEERVKSHLFFKDESGELIYWTKESENEPFKNALAYFYTTYIPVIDEGKDEPVVVDGENKNKSEYFTVEWFNTTVLEVEGDGRAYFEYVKVGEEVDKTQVANIIESADKQSVNNYLQHSWIQANRDLNKLASFKKLNNEYGFYNSLEFVLSSMIATALVYIVMPIILKNGVTVGKKVFGLCLATSDGYVFQNHQLFMRIMPLYVVILAMLIPVWNKLLAFFVAILVLGLVSFTLVMASPKKSSLHDFTARTIVVNQRTSILFNNSAEEEEYIAKEDNIELTHEKDGEEPGLKYER